MWIWKRVKISFLKPSLLINTGQEDITQYYKNTITHCKSGARSDFTIVELISLVYGDQVYELRRVKDTPNFISSRSKIVRRLRLRQYDPLTIERTIGLVFSPSTALCRPFLKHCTLTNKAVMTI